ncbi:MAG: ABC transporter permease [Coriobacteriia bacterium]|nr:ABC transporter permease [Coriobacteriia bacterium]
MLEKLGKKALVAPLAMAIVLCCVLSVAVGPMLRAEPHNVPFAIVNLDKGATTITGSANVGQTLTDKLLNGESSLGNIGSSSDESDESDSSTSSMADAISWTQLKSKEELSAAFDANELYGGIVIPSNFTSQQASSAVGLGKAPEITVYLNKGKSPQLASSLQTTIQNAMLKAGVACTVEIVNDADVGGGSMSSSMAVQMMVMPLFIMTMIGSILLSMLFWKKDLTGLKRKSPTLAAIVLLVLVAAFSAAIAGLAQFVDTVAGGMTLSTQELFLFLWLACACCMLCFVSLCCLSFPLGALVAVCTFALGMSCAMLTPEMLPQVWADWVYPWAPQAHIGNGVRSIVYLGQAPGNTDVYPLLAFGAVGLAALIAATLAACLKTRKTSLTEKQDKQKNAPRQNARA